MSCLAVGPTHVGIYITLELNINMVFILVSLAKYTFCTNCFVRCRYPYTNSTDKIIIIGGTTCRPYITLRSVSNIMFKLCVCKCK